VSIGSLCGARLPGGRGVGRASGGLGARGGEGEGLGRRVAGARGGAGTGGRPLPRARRAPPPSPGGDADPVGRLRPGASGGHLVDPGLGAADPLLRRGPEARRLLLRRRRGPLGRPGVADAGAVLRDPLDPRSPVPLPPPGPAGRGDPVASGRPGPAPDGEPLSPPRGPGRGGPPRPGVPGSPGPALHVSLPRPLAAPGGSRPEGRTSSPVAPGRRSPRGPLGEPAWGRLRPVPPPGLRRPRGDLGAAARACAGRRGIPGLPRGARRRG